MLFLFLPSRSKSDHIGIYCSRDTAHASLSHTLVANFLEFFEIISLITELSIFKTETTIFVRLSLTSIFIKRHQTAFTFCTIFFLHMISLLNFIITSIQTYHWSHFFGTHSNHILAHSLRHIRQVAMSARQLWRNRG